MSRKVNNQLKKKKRKEKCQNCGMYLNRCLKYGFSYHENIYTHIYLNINQLLYAGSGVLEPALNGL